MERGDGIADVNQRDTAPSASFPYGKPSSIEGKHGAIGSSSHNCGSGGDASGGEDELGNVALGESNLRHTLEEGHDQQNSKELAHIKVIVLED